MKNKGKQIRNLFLLLVAVLMSTASAFAQKETVKGTVFDDFGEPITGAAVLLKSDRTVGVATDIDGNFTLQVPDAKNAVLVVSFVGMATQEVRVNGAKTLKIVLQENVEVIEDVVVVGYGQQKKASVVGAITQATGETLQRAAGVTSIGSALTGNLPGVVTMTSSAVPGEEDPKIVIRGSSSWNNSDPLVLVDGIERPMGSVDMGSVQSISVLKDASATAVYGVKGANGVILITTKRGQDGKPQINVSANAIMKMPSKLPGKYDSYDAYMYRNVALEHEMNLNPGSWENYRPMGFINNFRNQTTQEQKERYPNVDWQDVLFKDFCMSYNAALNVSGGTKHVKYFAAVDYVNEGDLFETFDSGRGYTPKYGYNRVNVRSNLDFKITNTTTLKVNLAGSAGITEATWENATLDEWQVSQQFAGAFNLAPDVFLPRYSDGSYGYYPLVSNVTNSVEKFTLAGTNKTTKARINTDFILEQDLKFITPGLNFRGTVSWDNAFQEQNRGINDLYNNAQRTWVDPETGLYQHTQDRDANQQFDFSEGRHWSTSNGSVQNWATARNLYYQLQLNWARKFGKHDVSAMGLFSRSEQAQGSNLPNYREDWAFRVTYNYADRYNAEYNGAYNGSEKFSSKYRFAFFQSGAVGWTLTNEPFLKPLKEYMILDKHLVDFVKVRYSYGEIGDDNVAGRWLYQNTWAYGGVSRLDVNQGDSPYTWYREASLGNPDIHWEVVRKQNIGVDYSFLDGFLAGSVDIFKDKRSDVIVGGSSRAIPSYFGTSAPTANLGKVKTNGYEVEVRFNKSFKEHHRVWANASTKNPLTGELFFGGVNGITWFKPQDVLTSSHKWEVYISGFYIAGKPIKEDSKSGGRRIIDGPISQAKDIYLSNIDNAFTIEIGTNDLSNTLKKSIMYSMNNEGWISLPKGIHQVSFASLPSGTYNFKAKVIDGTTESDICTTIIHIRVPWWQSWWVISLLIAIILSLVYYFADQLRNRRILRHKMFKHIQSERNSESKLQFLTNVSHEIRTPMTLIINPLQQLISSDSDENRQRSYKLMFRNANRIMSLVNQLMDVRKIEHGQLKMKMKETELVAYLSSLTNSFEDIATSNNISLNFHKIGIEQLSAWIDEDNFDKVIMNLLSNALKYTPTGGSIDIYLTATEAKDNNGKAVKSAEIIVADNGQGIPDSELSKVFERFFQARNHKSGNGTGVGLHLTRSIVNLHHGTIKVENNPDKAPGCRFIVTIPLGNSHLKKEEFAEVTTSNKEKANYTKDDFSYLSANEYDKSSSEHENDDITSSQILVVEDDNEIRKYVKEQLSDKYKVTTCENGVEALEAIRAKIPSLLISDVMMPEMDGFTLCKKIRQNIQYNDLPIILLTAKTMNDDNIKGLEIGADAYITKPFDVRVLKQTISSLLRSRQTLRNIYSGNQAQTGKLEEIQTKSPDEKLVEKVMKVISDNIGNPDLSVELIADKVGISRVHLHRKLRQLTNQTTRDLIRNQRITLAAKILKEKKMPIAEVAYYVGFSSPAHFTTSFKQMYGISPTQFMKEADTAEI